MASRLTPDQPTTTTLDVPAGRVIEVTNVDGRAPIHVHVNPRQNLPVVAGALLAEHVTIEARPGASVTLPATGRTTVRLLSWNAPSYAVAAGEKGV